MKNKTGLTALIALATLLVAGQSFALPVPVSLYTNFGEKNIVTPYADKTSSKDVASIAGYDGGIENGTYKGSAMAFTEAQATGVFYGSAAAGAKVNWDALLSVNSQNPVNLYLTLNTWVSTDAFNLALGSVSHGILASFYLQNWLYPTTSYPAYGNYQVRMDNSDNLHTTIFLGTLLDPSKQVELFGRFEVASGLWFAGPGAMSSSAFGYLDFTLWADDPTLQPPNPAPEPSTLILLSLALMGLAGFERKKA